MTHNYLVAYPGLYHFFHSICIHLFSQISWGQHSPENYSISGPRPGVERIAQAHESGGRGWVRQARSRSQSRGRDGHLMLHRMRGNIPNMYCLYDKWIVIFSNASVSFFFFMCECTATVLPQGDPMWSQFFCPIAVQVCFESCLVFLSIVYIVFICTHWHHCIIWNGYFALSIPILSSVGQGSVNLSLNMAFRL